MSHLFYTRDLYVCTSCGHRANSQGELDKHYEDHKTFSQPSVAVLHKPIKDKQ